MNQSFSARHHYASKRQNRNKSSNAIPPLVVVGLCVLSFFAGSLWSLQATLGLEEECLQQKQQKQGPLGVGGQKRRDKELAHNVARVEQQDNSNDDDDKRHQRNNKKKQRKKNDNASNRQRRFPESMQRFASGMARIAKHDFFANFDLGVPVDLKPQDFANDVLVLYQRDRSVPQFANHDIKFNTNVPPMVPADQAFEKCDYLNIVLTDDGGSRSQCVALVPQYESFHVQKWMRVAVDDDSEYENHVAPLDSSQPLSMVSRGHQPNGQPQFAPPTEKETRKLWTLLQNYITNIDKVLQELQPIATRAAKKDNNNSVIVMVCNYGQSMLLMNWACSARARGLDTSQVLVFATDEMTRDLAQGLGLLTFYDQYNFADMPETAAKRYGDRDFTAVMLAKVICVQLVSMLGFNILFQDVDVVWYKNPLEWFLRQTDGFDVYFQDDGAHSIRYAPYAANSGFYFVRHNDKTQFFLTSLLHAGDLVIKTDSHQQALIALLSEHASLYGLKVKILAREVNDEFPGGYHFHQKSGQYMRRFFNNEVEPYIFHMSWTLNKDNKLLFFRQMGDWWVKDVCIEKKAHDILLENNANQDLAEACCSVEPLFSCHYRDQPCKTPCPDSPPLDNDNPSWWTRFEEEEESTENGSDESTTTSR